MEKNLIKVVCYGRIETWHSRARAKKFYNEAARACEGCERERYANIVFDLEDKKLICTDGYSCFNEALLNKRNYTTKAPDGSRDYGGKIWYED